MVTGVSQDPQATLECWAGDWRAEIKAAVARDPALAWDLVGDLETEFWEWVQREWSAWGWEHDDVHSEDPVAPDSFVETLDPHGLRFEKVVLLEQLVAARPRAARVILKHLRGLDARGRLKGSPDFWRAECQTWRALARQEHRGRSRSRPRIRVVARPRGRRARTARRASSTGADDGPAPPPGHAGRHDLTRADAPKGVTA